MVTRMLILMDDIDGSFSVLINECVGPVLLVPDFVFFASKQQINFN